MADSERLRYGKVTIAPLARQIQRSDRQAAECLKTKGAHARGRKGRSWMIIQLTPNRSRSWPNRVAKKVSCIGMKTSPPVESAEKIRSASSSLSTLTDKYALRIGWALG